MSNFFLDYAVTVSVLSNHKISIGAPHHKKKYYDRLSCQEQDQYLGWILEQAARMAKDYDDSDIKQFVSYEFETHPNITLKGGLLKRHVHGVYYHMSKDDIASIKQYLHKLCKVYNEKQQNTCVCIVPIYYNKGWKNYIEKDKFIREMDQDLLDLIEEQNQPPSPYDEL